MQKQILLLVLCSQLFVAFTFAQEFRVNIAMTAENKEILPHHFLGKYDGYFWYLGSEVRQHHNIGGKMSMLLLKMDDALKVVEAFPLEVKWSNDIQFMDKAILHDGTIYLLAQKVSGYGLKYDIFFIRYDLTGKLLNTLTVDNIKVKMIFGTSPPDWQRRMVVSPDGNWFYIFNINKSDKGWEPLVIKLSIVDLRRDSVWNQEIMLKEEKRYVDVPALKLLGNNEGEAFLLSTSNYAGPITRAEKKLKNKKNEVSYSLNSTRLIKVAFGGETAEKELNTRRDIIRTAFAKLGENGTLYYADMLSIDKSNTALHTYNLKKIDAESLEILHESSGTFNEFHFVNLDGLGLDVGEYGPPRSAYLYDMIIDQNGGLKLILRTSNQLTGQSSKTVYTFHQAIYVMDINAQGSINWAITLPHGHLADARLKEGNVFTKEKNGSLLVFFNSVPKILDKDDTEIPKTGEARSLLMNQTAIGFIMVDPDGNYSKHTLMEDYLSSGDFGQIGNLADEAFSFSMYTFKQKSKPTGALLKVTFE